MEMWWLKRTNVLSPGKELWLHIDSDVQLSGYVVDHKERSVGTLTELWWLFGRYVVPF